MSTQPRSTFAEVAYTNGYEFTEGSGYTLPEYPFVIPPELAHGTIGRHEIVIVGGGITGSPWHAGWLRVAFARCCWTRTTPWG
jgi:hypothetical protein